MKNNSELNEFIGQLGEALLIETGNVTIAIDNKISTKDVVCHAARILHELMLEAFIFIWLAFATMFPKKFGEISRGIIRRFKEGFSNE